MGLFRLFKKSKSKESESTGSVTMPKSILKAGSHTEQMDSVKDYCEIILDSKLQMEEAKAEYQAVTSYLTDIQKIELIPLPQRGAIEEAARSIYNLSKERSKLQNRSTMLSDQQYRLFERYEPQIPKELPAIRKAEEYQTVIQQDITHLEKERGNLDREQKDIISRQAFLKGMAGTTCIVILVLFLLLAFIAANSKADFTMPFLLTVLMGMAAAIYILIEARKNVLGMRLVQIKQNRQIMLMNKVKIKSVNNRNYLDYTFQKYNIECFEQLKDYWEEYVRLKDEARRYQSNTELLEFYNNQLIQELKNFKIADAEIWIFQTNAILNNKEMVEVRHRLNVRRQKLRERIDINSKQKEEALKSIQTLRRNHPDSAIQIEKMMRRYQIDFVE